jgi:hypothetical protein
MDKWVGIKRRAGTLIERRLRISGKLKTIPNGTPGLSPLLDRAIAAGETHSQTMDQVRAHDRKLAEMIETTRERGGITDDVAAQARSRLQIGGLGELVSFGIGLLIVVAAGVLAYIAKESVLQWRRDTPAIEREIGTTEVLLSGLERATDLAIEQARAKGVPVALPNPVDYSGEQDAADKVAKVASSVGTLAVVGFGLFLASKLFGGSKK